VILADLSDIPWDSFVQSSRRVLNSQDAPLRGSMAPAVAVPESDNDDILFSGYDFSGGGEGAARPHPPSDSDVDIVETSDDEVDSGRLAPPPLILSDDSPGPCSDSDAMDTG